MSRFHMRSRTKRRLAVSGYYALVLAIAVAFFGLVVNTNIPRSAAVAQQIPFRYQSEIAGGLFAVNVLLMISLPVAVIAWIEPDGATDDEMISEV
jgi:hypothetical protein